MRRRISLLLAAVMAGTTLMLFGPAQPASGVVVCGGVGTVAVQPGLLYPVLYSIGDPTNQEPAPGLDHFIDMLIGNQTNTIHSFVVNFAAGACVHVRVPPTVSGVTGNGTLLGFCGHSTGTGTIGGQQFAYVSAGTLLVLTGHVVGAASAFPTPLTGSCLHVGTNPPTSTFGLPGGATQFNVQGAGVGLNCNNGLPILLNTLVGVETLQLTQPVGVHTGGILHVTAMTPCTNPSVILP